MYVNVASVNIINMFYGELIIYVDNIAIMWDVYVTLLCYLCFEKNSHL